MEPEEPVRVQPPGDQTQPSPADTRTSFLDQSAQGDETLLTQVFITSEKTEAPVSPPPAVEEPATLPDGPARPAIRRGELKPGDTLGDCRIISLIGEGGMGEVYLAEDTRLERRVAVKLLKRYLADEEIERRFRHERKVLAALSHPGIAQLYGAALSPEGRSYFVMEYVEGERIDYYCNRHKLGVPERLELFRKVCAAVAYAHQHLVVHRDLKPPNIRVTPEGEPKLLDFGIAKLLDTENGDTAENTLTVTGSMTPAYASPEQLRGEGITTSTDIYSLGVILYELLVGERPYVVQRGLPEEVAQAICEAAIRRPSDAATQTAKRPASAVTPVTFQGTPPDKLRRLLVGDLDNIVVMAMRKEPARRYVSVAQFAEDIRRHLDGRPVVARPDTLRYRTSKFIRRNKVGVIAAVFVLLSLVGGLIATIRETRRANRRFDDVRQLAKAMIFEVEPQISPLAGATQARATLINRAIDYLDSLSREAGSNRELREELATAYEKVGDVQGNPIYSNLGNLKGALESYGKARTLREALVKEEPGDAVARHRLASHLEEFGTLLAWTNQVARGMEYYRLALKLRRPLLVEDPKNFKFRFGYASLLMTTGDLENWNENFAEASKDFAEALTIMQQLSSERPKEAELKLYVARCYAHSGDVKRDAGDYPAAAPLYAQAQEVVAAVVKDDPANQSARLVEWVVAYQQCEALKNQGANDQAIAACPAMTAKAQALAEKDPKNTAYQHNLANSYNTYGGALLQANRYPEAVEQLRKAAGIDGQLCELSPENGEYPHSLGDCLWGISRAEFRQEKYDAAKIDALKASRLLESAAAKDPSNATPARGLVRVYITLGEICGQQKDLPEARQWFERGLQHLEGLIARKISNKDDEENLPVLRNYLAALPPANPAPVPDTTEGQPPNLR